MPDFDELKMTIRRNKLIGMWAAEKLGITGLDAAAYSDAFAVGALDAEQYDVFSKIRGDFDRAGVIQSDEQILRAMNDLMFQAVKQMQISGGGAADAAGVWLVRNLTSR